MQHDRSTIGLLGQLQRHGLTRDVLETWVGSCVRHETGQLTLHVHQGQVTGWQVVVSGKVRDVLAHEE